MTARALVVQNGRGSVQTVQEMVVGLGRREISSVQNLNRGTVNF